MRDVGVDQPVDAQLVFERLEEGLVVGAGDEVVHVLVERLPFADDVDVRWVFGLLEVVECVAGVGLHYGFGVREILAQDCIVDRSAGCEAEEGDLGDGHLEDDEKWERCRWYLAKMWWPSVVREAFAFYITSGNEETSLCN